MPRASTKIDRRLRSPFARPETKTSPPETPASDVVTIVESNKPPAIDTEAERADSSMQRLTAVLSDGVQLADSLPQRSLTALDDRIRVESLISQAKQLLEVGDLEQAGQTAQMALELGETAMIDYAPDEDRPIDLVHRIQALLEETAPKEHKPEAAPSQSVAESPDVTIEADKADTMAQSPKSGSPTGKDSSNLGRIRRDWSTLFRRDKKQTAQEAVPAIRIQNRCRQVP